MCTSSSRSAQSTYTVHNTCKNSSHTNNWKGTEDGAEHHKHNKRRWWRRWLLGTLAVFCCRCVVASRLIWCLLELFISLTQCGAERIDLFLFQETFWLCHTIGLHSLLWRSAQIITLTNIRIKCWRCKVHKEKKNSVCEQDARYWTDSHGWISKT